ncbi:MAG: efflux RND transporter periplasmic adaptor subunit [Cyanobacteria bacterium P01_F01_bin.53]
MTYQNFQESEDNSLELTPLSTDTPDDIANHDIHKISKNLAPNHQSSSLGPLSGWLSGTLGGALRGATSGSNGLLVGLGLGLGLALLLTRFTSTKTAEADTAVDTAVPAQVASASVTTARAQSEPIRETITANGTVRAFDLLSVSPRASGLQIQSITVREGDRVATGQVLALLDDAVLQAQIDQAEAQVIAAEAQVAQAQAQANQNQAALAEAQDQLERYENLFAQGAISEEEVATRRTQVITAEQTLGASTAGIDSARATVRSSQAEVERLNTQLGQTQVLAPSNGIIAEKNASVGDTASSGTPLFEIISDGQLELEVKVPQTQLAQINLGTLVQITSSTNKNIQLQGSVRSIDPTLDANTRQATVKVGLPSSDLLRPGMFLKAAITTRSRQGVVIPADAVLPQTSGGFVVYTLNADSTVKAQTVNIGERIPATDSDPAKIEISSGLTANTPIVVEGASYLQDGDTVTVATGETGAANTGDTN